MLDYRLQAHSLLLLLLLCTACLPNQDKPPFTLTVESIYENPLPRPEFVMDVTSGPGLIEFVQAQCIILNQEPFWEEGFSSNELYAHLMANIDLTVDGLEVLGLVIP